MIILVEEASRKGLNQKSGGSLRIEREVIIEDELKWETILLVNKMSK